MMTEFVEILSTALEDVDGEASLSQIEDITDEILSITREIDQIQDRLLNLNNRYDILKKKALANLATLAKSKRPDADIRLDSDRLQINNCYVVPTDRGIDVQSPGRELTGDAQVVAQALISSILPEMKTGKGRLLVEGKRMNLIGLYQHRDSL